MSVQLAADTSGFLARSYSYGKCANECSELESNSPFTAGATIAPGAVYTTCNGASASPGLGSCDQTDNAITGFNGDDVVALKKGSDTIIDQIGSFSSFTKWKVCGGTEDTEDHLLTRTPDTCCGVVADAEWLPGFAGVCSWIAQATPSAGTATVPAFTHTASCSGGSSDTGAPTSAPIATRYTEETATRFNGANPSCKAHLISTIDACDTVKKGKEACDAATDCNAFIRNTDDGKCYTYNMPADEFAECKTTGATHTQVRSRSLRVTATLSLSHLKQIWPPLTLPISRAPSPTPTGSFTSRQRQPLPRRPSRRRPLPRRPSPQQPLLRPQQTPRCPPRSRT